MLESGCIVPAGLTDEKRLQAEFQVLAGVAQSLGGCGPGRKRPRASALEAASAIPEHRNPTWSLKGRLANTGRLLAHLMAMKSSCAEVSWALSRPQGEAAGSGSLLVTSMFSSAVGRHGRR